MVKHWIKEDYFFIVNPYYSLLRRACIIIGAWPYKTRKEQGLRFYLTFFLFAFFLIGQILPYFVTDSKLFAFVESFLTVGMTIAVASQYYCVNYKQINHLRTLLNQIINDWYHLKTAKELMIAHKYGEKTRSHIYLYLLMCYSLIIGIILAPFIFITMDFVVKGNVSHQHIWPFQLKFFSIIDQEKHLLPFVFMFLTLNILLVAVCSANLGLLLMLTVHACGMFRIVGVIFESAFNQKGLPSKELDEEKTSAILFRGIMHHNRVIKFINKLNSLYNTAYMIHIIYGNLAMGVDMIMLMQLDINMENMQRFLVLVVHLFCLFLIALSQCHYGQRLLDHSINVFEETSIMPWYKLSPRLQKLSLVILMRSKKQCSLTIVKFFTPSHELFAKGIQFALSYAMVYHSIHSN